MHTEDKDHTAEEYLLDLMKQGLPPEEVIRKFKEDGYTIGGEEEEVVEEKFEEKEEGKEGDEEGVIDLKIKKVSVIDEGMEDMMHPVPRMGKLLLVARKAMKKERGE